MRQASTMIWTITFAKKLRLVFLGLNVISSEIADATAWACYVMTKSLCIGPVA